MSLLKQPDEFEDISSDVLQRYQLLQLEIGDEKLSVESFLSSLILNEGVQSLKPIVKKSRSNDNPYILLLFGTENMEWVDYRESAEKIYDELMAYQSMYSNEMSKIHEIVTKTIPKLSANDYKEVQITVGLDNFAVPILSASADASYYKRALYHINLIL